MSKPHINEANLRKGDYMFNMSSEGRKRLRVSDG